MLRGQESISQYSWSNTTIWMTMAFQAGVLNIGGFMSCHRFVSHITGFATYFGYEISMNHFFAASTALAVPVFFLMGSMISGQLVDVRLRAQQKPLYFAAFTLMFVMIGLVYIGGNLFWFGRFGEPSNWSSDYSLLAMLCLVCGIQNGTITSVSRAVVRTTHLTGITTDLGIGIMRVLNARQFQYQIHDEIKANFMRAGIIVFFVLGSIVGGLVFRKNGYSGFALPLFTTGVLLLVTARFHLRKLG